MFWYVWELIRNTRHLGMTAAESLLKFPLNLTNQYPVSKLGLTSIFASNVVWPYTRLRLESIFWTRVGTWTRWTWLHSCFALVGSRDYGLVLWHSRCTHRICILRNQDNYTELVLCARLASSDFWRYRFLVMALCMILPLTHIGMFLIINL